MARQREDYGMQFMLFVDNDAAALQEKNSNPGQFLEIPFFSPYAAAKKNQDEEEENTSKSSSAFLSVLMFP